MVALLCRYRVIMELLQVTYQGPPVDDPELFELLPPELRALLEQINGFVQFGGGLHIRGASRDPDWHSLRRVWMSDHAFHSYYRAMGATDVNRHSSSRAAGNPVSRNRSIAVRRSAWSQAGAVIPSTSAGINLPSAASISIASFVSLAGSRK